MVIGSNNFINYDHILLEWTEIFYFLCNKCLPSQEYDSCYPFVLCVWAIDIAI